MILTTLKFIAAPAIFLLGCVFLAVTALVFYIKTRYTAAHEA